MFHHGFSALTLFLLLLLSKKQKNKCNYSAHEQHHAIQACTRHLRGLLIEDLVFKRIDPRSDASRMTQYRLAE